MTNTESAFRFSPVLALRAGAVLAEWPELGPLVAAPAPVACSRPGSWVVCVGSTSELLFPSGCEVRLS